MLFKYLGETYEVDKQIYDSCKKRNATRRLFSFAVNTTPCKDKKKYYLLFCSTPDNLNIIAISSNPRKYLRELRAMHPGLAKHKSISDLTHNQAHYLKELLTLQTDYHKAIPIAMKEIKVFS